MPRTGLKARRTLRSRPMFMRPAAARKTNHAVMTGPKSLPIVEVPAFWRKKSTQRMAITMATTMLWLSPMSE